MDVRLPNGQTIKGVPEGTPKEAIMQKAIAAGLATEQDFVQSAVSDMEQRPTASGPTTQNGFKPYEQPKPKEEGSWTDFFFGEKDQRSVFNAPELNELSFRALKAGLGGLLTGDPKELQGIIQKQYPEAVLGDMQGQPAVQLPSGTYLLNPEGLDLGDVGRFGVDVAAFTPAGRVTGTGLKALGKGAAVAGATQTGMQTAEAALGGEFNAEDVALEAATQGVFQVAEPAIRASAQKIKDTARPFIKKVAEKFNAGAAEAPYEAVAENLKSGKVENVMPEIMADPEVMKAADELGINVNPGVYSTSDIYREMENALKVVPGSKLSAQEKETVRQLGQKADELIAEFGGFTDKSQLSYDFKESALSTIDTMANEASDLYKMFDEVIPKSLKVKPKSTLQYIDNQIMELGGIENIDPKLASVYSKLKDKPTYALLEKTRKDIGDALKGSGPFKDASQNDLKRLYGTLSDDALGVAGFFGLTDEVAAAKQLVKDRKALEESLQGALGKDLSRDLMAEVSAGVRGLAKGQTGKWSKTLDAVPEEQRQQVVVTALNDLFSGGATKAKEFSLGGFTSTYEALKRNKKASEELFKYLPNGAQKRLDDMYKVTKGLMELNKKDLNNPSGTARQVIAGMNSPDGIFAKLYNVGKQASAGAVATSPFDAGMIGATAGAVNALRSSKTKATQAADELLSSPGFKDAMDKYIKGDKEAANGIMSKLSSFRKWLSEQPPEVKRSVARQGVIEYLREDEDNADNQQ